LKICRYTDAKLKGGGGGQREKKKKGGERGERGGAAAITIPKCKRRHTF